MLQIAYRSKYGHIYAHMKKTTVEIDESKLETIMRLTGLPTRKEAIDWALTEAERLAKINRIAEAPWDPEMLKNAIDPNYDVLAARHRPVNYRKH